MLKFFTEFSPLIAFFIGYKTKGIFEATLYMLVASIIGISITYYKEKKVSMVNVVSSGLLLVSCSLTLFSGNTIFIKMKPTMLYFVFALIFFVTNFKWQPATKFLLGKSINLKDDSNWKTLNIRFMIFFLLMGLINEITWRNFSEEIWVNFKVLGALPLTLVFIVSQMPFIMHHKTN